MTCPTDGLTVSVAETDYVGGGAAPVVELSCGHIVTAPAGVLTHTIKDSTGAAVKAATAKTQLASGVRAADSVTAYFMRCLRHR